MQTMFDTTHVARSERLSYWQESACDAYLPIACDSKAGTSFEGKIALSRLSRLNLSIINASQQTVSRDRRMIARNADRFFMVSVPIGADCRLHQDTREAHLRPGDFAIYATDQPYRLDCSDGVDQMVIQLPYEKLRARLPNAETLTARRVDGTNALNRMAYAHLRQYAAVLEEQPPEVQHLLQEIMLDLIAASLATLHTTGYELSRPQTLSLMRAKQFIRGNLQDHDLDPTRVAQATGLSRRSLRRLFAESGDSLSGYLRDARLDKAAEDLRNPLCASQSISEIAVKWGMDNFSHFTRTFKARFGQTPTEFRNQK
ncbi:helix-turn-helix domain-containing protein [Epibacterium ulvae]|uniref:AraC-like ligand-binding domain-containing protein n=1 Tax=Epibacterium ulvae TaxID=1156985 RepID=UPI00248FA565|nr:helix-turn-helix domain-containing protein [Epibacterium ulvae]